MLNVLDSTKNIVQNLKEVSINKTAIEKLVTTITSDQLTISEIDLAKNTWTKEQLIELVFLFNTVNFCFWSNKNEKKWTIQDDNLDGAVALFRSLENALKQNPDLLQSDELNGLSLGDLRTILVGNVTIPLLSERHRNINNYGKTLESKFSGSVFKLLEEANYDALKLCELLVDNFDCFQDASTINDITVAFYKRAQLNSKMIHDVLIHFGEKGLTNLDKLTAFADYKIPQLLRKIGILTYSNSLANKIDNYELVPVNSIEEVEIRAATIWSAEYLKETLLQKFDFVTSAHIDGLLWLRSQDKSANEKPYHRTLTTAY